MTATPTDYGRTSDFWINGQMVVLSYPMALQPGHYTAQMLSSRYYYSKHDLCIGNDSGYPIADRNHQFILSKNNSGNTYSTPLTIPDGTMGWSVSSLPLEPLTSENGSFPDACSGLTASPPKVSVASLFIGSGGEDDETVYFWEAETEFDYGYSEIDISPHDVEICERVTAGRMLYEEFCPLSSWLMKWATVESLNEFLHQSAGTTCVPLQQSYTEPPPE